SAERWYARSSSGGFDAIRRRWRRHRVRVLLAWTPVHSPSPRAVRTPWRRYQSERAPKHPLEVVACCAVVSRSGRGFIVKRVGCSLSSRTTGQTSSYPDHCLNCVWRIRPAASGQMPLLCQCRADLAQRHSPCVHLARQCSHFGPRLGEGFAAATLASERLLAIACGFELVDQPRLFVLRKAAGDPSHHDP